MPGCAKLFGNLRPDLDDSPTYYDSTVGGSMPDSGRIADDDLQRQSAYGPLGHNERMPAAAAMRAYSPAEEGRSWIGAEDQEQQQRDRLRTGINYSDAR